MLQTTPKSAVIVLAVAMMLSMATAASRVANLVYHPLACALVGLYNVGSHTYDLPEDWQLCTPIGCTGTATCDLSVTNSG